LTVNILSNVVLLLPVISLHFLEMTMLI
jgi:hypothetical protein